MKYEEDKAYTEEPVNAEEEKAYPEEFLGDGEEENAEVKTEPRPAGETAENPEEPETQTKGEPRLWRNARKDTTYRMVVLAILIALTAALQIAGSFIKPIGPTSLSFVLIPIVVGGMLLGVRGGAVLGATFGMVTIIMGFTGMDAFTSYLITYSPSNAVITCAVCMVKAVAAGAVSALVHGALKKKWPFASTVIAAVTAPIVNTGIFMLGATLMLKPLAELAGNVIYFLFVTILVFNFLVELAINVVAAPAIYRIWQVVGKKRAHKPF